jgi:phage terminase, small subunit, putative, P27 family
MKVLRGKLKAPRKDEPQLPPVSADFDEPPPELREDSRAITEWARVVPILRTCGIISHVERGALIALCQQWSRYLEAQHRIHTLGMVVKLHTGVPAVNPYLKVSDRALTHCRHLWTELGLTPSGRSRMSTLPQMEAPQKSKWAGLL